MKIKLYKQWARWYHYRTPALTMFDFGPVRYVNYRPSNEPPKPSTGMHPSGRG